MKWFSILMLIANIAYLGWELEQQSATHRREQKNLPSIPLSAKELIPLDLSKLKDNELLEITGNQGEQNIEFNTTHSLNSDFELELKLGQLEPSEQSDPGKSDEKSIFCLSYGPIEGDDDADKLTKYFSVRGVKVNKRQAIKKSKLYWVYLTPRSNQGRASNVLNDLKEKGVTDYQLIKSGKFKDAISLGLFSTKERVDVRLKEISDKGYKPVVVPYHKPDTKRIYWLDTQFKMSSEEFSTTVSGLPKELNYQTISCSNIALSTYNP